MGAVVVAATEALASSGPAAETATCTSVTSGSFVPPFPAPAVSGLPAISLSPADPVDVTDSVSSAP
jgi:hypothetical protein